MFSSFSRLNLCLVGVASFFWLGATGFAADLPRVPEGFTIEIAAESPVVDRPVMANFDERGRLYCVDSSGANLRFNELVMDPPHSIVVLEDTNGDGRFDKRHVFADKLVMPQGVLPHGDAVYVASPPSVWKLEDTDGDGVADKRTEIVTEFGSNGNAADIHGPFLGPDGWLYLCDGRHGHKVTRPDGSVDQGLAGGIFRFRTDGSSFQRVCGGGFDNPVEIDFLPNGEIVGTVNILYGRPRVDCLVHWIEGGAYPRHDQEQCLSELKSTGDLLKPLAEYGHVAVAGMTRFRSISFGSDYQDNLFITFFNRHKLIRSVLERNGSTFQSKEEDFLVSDDIDFHPTDVLEDADGSLLVINTGGWFRIGCPQSQIAKPDVLGQIYRIRRVGATPPADPRGLKLVLDELSAQKLASLLEDDRPAVRTRVVEQLVQRGADVVPAVTAMLTESAGHSVLARQQAVWTLSRLPNGNPAIALSDSDAGVRMVAAQASAAAGIEAAVPALAGLLTDADPSVRREAATAIGRLTADRRFVDQNETAERQAALAALFAALRAGAADRYQEHALVYSAIQMTDRTGTIPFLNDPSPRVRLAALRVLDQMDDGHLSRELVTPLLDTDDTALQSEALRVIGRHPGWGEEIVQLLTTWLQDEELTDDRQNTLRGVLLAQSADPKIQKLMAVSLTADQTVPAVRLLLWEVVSRATITELPAEWLTAVDGVLQTDDTALRMQVLPLIQARGLDRYDSVLVKLADNREQPLELRLEALAIVAPRLAAVSNTQFNLLETQLDPDASPLLQLAAARTLADAPLSLPQMLRLGKLLSSTSPLVTPLLLRAFSRTTDVSVGNAFVKALEKSPSASSLSADELAGLLRKYPKEVQKGAEKLLASLGTNLAIQQARLVELAPLLLAGDVERGRTVFYSKKAACSSCHAVGGEGSRVGPDLTRIGAARSGADLLEAVVFPSASFAREFRPYTIATNGGKVHTGIISRQTSDAIHLRTAELAEVRVARDDIDEMRESSTSIMPQALEKLLTPEELRDLLAYLQSRK